MASFLSSKLRKVQEVLGTATVTEDAPQVRDAKEHLSQLKVVTSNMLKYSRRVAGDYDKVARSEEKLGSSLVEYSGSYPQSPLGEALIRVGESQHAIASLQRTFASRLQESLIFQARSIQEEDLKRFSEVKYQHEELRVTYDIALSKRKEFNNKANDPKYQQKIDECDLQVSSSHTGYENASNQLVLLLNEFDEKISSSMIQTLKHYCEAQEEMIKHHQTILSQLLPVIGTLEKQNAEILEKMYSEIGGKPGFVNLEKEYAAPPSYNDPPSYDDPPPFEENPPAFFSPPPTASSPPPVSSAPPPVNRSSKMYKDLSERFHSLQSENSQSEPINSAPHPHLQDLPSDPELLINPNRKTWAEAQPPSDHASNYTFLNQPHNLASSSNESMSQYTFVDNPVSAPPPVIFMNDINNLPPAPQPPQPSFEEVHPPNYTEAPAVIFLNDVMNLPPAPQPPQPDPVIFYADTHQDHAPPSS